MFWVLKRTVPGDGSFEHPKHMIWLRSKEFNPELHLLAAIFFISSQVLYHDTVSNHFIL